MWLGLVVGLVYYEVGEEVRVVFFVYMVDVVMVF